MLDYMLWKTMVFLSSTFGECPELIAIAEDTDAQNSKHLPGNLVDVVQRINNQSSSLLKLALSELQKLNVAKHVEKSNDSMDYSPIERLPANKRKVLSDADRICLIKQGPFQPKLSRYPKHTDSKDKHKQCSFSSEWFEQYPHIEYSLHTNKVYCYVCQLFPQKNSNDTWIKDGQDAWEKMKSVGKKKKGKLAATLVVKVTKLNYSNWLILSIQKGTLTC